MKKRDIVFIIFFLVFLAGVVSVGGGDIACYQNSDCGHDGCAGDSNYCCDNEVCQVWIFFSCNNRGAFEAFCSNVTSPLMLEDCTEQGLVCKNGFCLEAECYVDEDCGNDDYSDNYCKDDDVVRDHMVPFCEVNECEANVIRELVEDCGEDYLEEWGANYCEDNDVYHNRTHHYKGCGIGLSACYDNTHIEEKLVEECRWGCDNGECINREIACYVDEDCGRDGFVGNDYCLFGDIYESWVDFTCHNPGTNESFCSNVTEPVLMDECEFGCEDGFCIDEECQENEDCGEEELINNYCSGNEIWSNYSIPVCVEGGCEINYTQIFNQTCEFGCEDGECAEGIHDVALIDFSGSLGGIKITNEDGTGNLAILTCDNKYRIYITIKNLGDFYENVTFNGEVNSLLFNHLPINNFASGDDSLKYRTVNFTLESGIYNITIEAIIPIDINISNNFAERQIEIVCPRECTPEQNETRTCGLTDVGECQFGEQIKVCDEEGQWGNWSECVRNIEPINETCDGLDNNCNNETDEGLDCEEGTCDARSKGYWKNNGGCSNGEGESNWNSEVNSLSDSFFDVFVEINRSEICISMADVCQDNMLCKAKQMLLADELNVVSGKLQLNAIVAGAVNGYEDAFSNLGLNSSSTIEQTLEKVEQVISDENSSEQDLKDGKDVAERIYEFYEDKNGESENPNYPECLHEWNSEDDNNNETNNENSNGNGGGGGRGGSSIINLNFCKDCNKNIEKSDLLNGEDSNKEVDNFEDKVIDKSSSKISTYVLLVSIFLVLLTLILLILFNFLTKK